MSLVLICFTASLLAATPFEGMVVSVDAEGAAVTLEHEAIDELSPAGTHPFSISASDLELLQPGDAMKGEAIAYRGGLRVEHVYRINAIDRARETAINKRLRRETVTAGSRVFRGVGDFMPDFALYNQSSDLVTNTDLRGKRVMMNFIFTRCGMPTMCPAATQRMAEIQSVLDEEGIDDVQLVTVSFDPEYDSPGILRQYAESKGIHEGNYHFLTGELRPVLDLMATFGIFTRGEGPMQQHTMATLFFDEDGKVVYRKEGSRWSSEEFLKLIRRSAS